MKITNKMLEQYLVMEKKVSEMQKHMSELKTILKEKGSFSTSEFVVSVTERTSKRLPGAEELAEILEIDLRPYLQPVTSVILSVSKKKAS